MLMLTVPVLWCAGVWHSTTPGTQRSGTLQRRQQNGVALYNGSGTLQRWQLREQDRQRDRVVRANGAAPSRCSPPSSPPSGRQSDGIVPLASQRFPAGHPNCHVAQLNSRRSSCSQAGGGGRDADELQVAQLRGRLRRGTWSWADAAPVAHGRSALYVGSELFEHAIRVVVPAIAEETARTRAAGDGSD